MLQSTLEHAEMSPTTKTLNPLHFEDLEPHRFEDLIRQLAYDFREWSNLEATGRSGGDDGFDIRGREVIGMSEDETEQDDIVAQERIWLIQCKREKTITPKKLTGYAHDVLLDQSEPIYGVIFAAACNFSKKARDQFIAKIREHGVQEFQLWGRAELEDMLFQPKNDHLLFAYFQISLRVRMRTTKTLIRSRLATKRKVMAAIGNGARDFRPVLLRDPREDRYPCSEDIPDFTMSPKWKVLYFTGLYHSGLKFLGTKFYAYLADDHVHFDIARCFNNTNTAHLDPWTDAEDQQEQRQRVELVWNRIPEQNRGHLTETVYLPYDRILAIDDHGDNIFDEPHIYIEFDPDGVPFCASSAVIDTIGVESVRIHPEKENRIEYFPDELREKPE